MNGSNALLSISQRRRGRLLPSFTLVELLVAITIIGIMAGMVMYTLAGAQRDSLVARTQGTIKKLNEIILFRWEEFRYRAVKINIPDDFLSPIEIATTGQSQTPLSPREGSRLRMMILRDTMRMEFPDRYSDILYPPTIYKAAVFTADNSPPLVDTSNDLPLVIERSVPGSYNSFRKRMTTGVGGGALPNPYPATTIPTALGTLKPTIENQGAELLYQIVATSNYNGSNGLEFFRPTEIGDTDNDGFPEFIDAWGKPIRWIRWPAGYGVVNASKASPPYSPPFSPVELQSARPVDAQLNDTSVPDVLDPLRTDWRWSDPAFKMLTKPWLLVPLIVSAGPDSMFDLAFDYDSAAGGPVVYATQTWTRPTDSPAHSQGPSPYGFVDPYFSFYSTGVTVTDGYGGLGEWFDEDKVRETFGAADNITNYSLILQ